MKSSPIKPSGGITVEHYRFPGHEAQKFRDLIPEDRYVLRLPIRPGKLTITHNGKLLHDGPVLPGMMRVVAPGVEEIIVARVPWEAVAINLPGSRLRATLEKLNPNRAPGRILAINALLRPQFQVEQLGRLALNARSLDPTHAELFVEGVADALLACLLSQQGIDQRTDARPREFTAGEFQQVVDYAEAHLQSTLDLARWATVLGVSASEFTRRFRVATGTSPYAWFLHRRIDRGKELLGSTRDSIGQIAFSVGFCSQSHFADAFRRRVGTSPARWRQDQRRAS